MTVQELIRALQSMPDDAIVAVRIENDRYGGDYDDQAVSSVAEWRIKKDLSYVILRVETPESTGPKGTR